MGNKAKPWSCPWADYTADNRRGRAGHLRETHGLDPAPTDDDGIGPEVQLPMGDPPVMSAAQTDKVDQLMGKIDGLVDALKAQGIHATVTTDPPATSTEVPTLDQVIAHCESGRCAAHTKAWDDAKAKIVEAAYEQIPNEVLRAKARAAGIAPDKIVFEVATPAGRAT